MTMSHCRNQSSKKKNLNSDQPKISILVPVKKIFHFAGRYNVALYKNDSVSLPVYSICRFGSSGRFWGSGFGFETNYRIESLLFILFDLFDSLLEFLVLMLRLNAEISLSLEAVLILVDFKCISRPRGAYVRAFLGFWIIWIGLFLCVLRRICTDGYASSTASGSTLSAPEWAWHVFWSQVKMSQLIEACDVEAEEGGLRWYIIFWFVAHLAAKVGGHIQSVRIVMTTVSAVSSVKWCVEDRGPIKLHDCAAACKIWTLVAMGRFCLWWALNNCIICIINLMYRPGLNLFGSGSSKNRIFEFISWKDYRQTVWTSGGQRKRMLHLIYTLQVSTTIIETIDVYCLFRPYSYVIGKGAVFNVMRRIWARSLMYIWTMTV